MDKTTKKFTKDDFLNAAALVKKLSLEYGTTYDLESVKKAFDENGIEVPYNQIDVHVKNS